MYTKWIGCHDNNFWVGRENYKKPELVVLHWMAGTLEACDKVFQDGRRQTSAHYGIGGKEIHQYVIEDNTAYHSGVWDVNTKSIGIEHEGNVDLPISEDTYKSSIQLVAEVCGRYAIPIDSDHIKGHRDFKATQCPGTLDVNRIITEAKKWSESQGQLVITDQTKIPQLDNQEVQAIRSKINDLTNQTISQAKTITNLTSKLKSIFDIVWGKWTWLGLTGWKTRLQQLKNIV